MIFQERLQKIYGTIKLIHGSFNGIPYMEQTSSRTEVEYKTVQQALYTQHFLHLSIRFVLLQ